MKTSLQLNMGQHLMLTPQLQQAIRLLQLSTIDLQYEIQSLIESNPMLEATPTEDKDEQPGNLDLFDEERDFQWSQLYKPSNKQNFNENDYNFENMYSTTTTLHDHLHWQLNLTPMSDFDRAIATTIIDAINDDGFLTLSIAELQDSLDHKEHSISTDEIEAVRHRIQHFDPVGCASLSLSECLLVQIMQLSEHTPHLIIIKKIIQNDLKTLGQHNYKQLIKKYSINHDIFKIILNTIHALNPKPGRLIHQNTTEFIVPDVSVKKIADQWQVKLNQTLLPDLSINKHYAALIKPAGNSVDNRFLKHNLQEARWFLKSIESRQETLFNVAKCIVDYQKDFLEHGAEAMKPLILNDVASALDIHESTVSRVTTQKYLHTPRGVYELKYFFSSHIDTSSGSGCSSTAVRAVIKKLIAAENYLKPLSDNQIAKLLKTQGVQIARRTITKYREGMGILPSFERKGAS